MARPAKSVGVISKNLTQEERETREETEKLLKGKADKVKPFDYLTTEQVKIFKHIVKELNASGIIGNLDVYVLNRCAVAIDRINSIDKDINNEPDKFYDADVLKARKEYVTDFNKCCQELCLSPQARAKIGTINVAKKEESKDPLLKVLRGGG